MARREEKNRLTAGENEEVWPAKKMKAVVAVGKQ